MGGARRGSEGLQAAPVLRCTIDDHGPKKANHGNMALSAADQRRVAMTPRGPAADGRPYIYIETLVLI